MSKKMDPKSPMPQRLSDGRASTTPSKLRKSCMSMRIFTPNSLDNNGFDVDSPVGAPRKKTITIDPNAKSAEIPRVVRSNLNKFTVPDSDKVFQFKCSGEIGGDSQVAGKKIVWKAKFERPIEELIYPSLQRFDIAGYERRMQNRQKFQNEHNGSAKTPSNIKYFNNHEPESAVRLEPISPHMLPTNEDIVYVHTPQWTVQLHDSPKSRSRANTSDSHSLLEGILGGGNTSNDSEIGDDFADLAEEIDIQGERYLRQRIKASVIEKEEERQRREKLAMGFLLGLNRRPAVEVTPMVLTPAENANNLVSVYRVYKCMFYV